jgi:hypothetical protein
MHSNNRKIGIGALTGLAYFAVYFLIGEITGFSHNLGALFLIPLNGLALFLQSLLPSPFAGMVNGMIAMGLPYGLAILILHTLQTFFAALPNVFLGAVVGRFLPAQERKPLFWQGMLAQLVLALVIGLPLMYIAAHRLT